MGSYCHWTVHLKEWIKEKCYVHFTTIFKKIIASGSYLQIKYPRLAENKSLLEGF